MKVQEAIKILRELGIPVSGIENNESQESGSREKREWTFKYRGNGKLGIDWLMEAESKIAGELTREWKDKEIGGIGYRAWEEWKRKLGLPALWEIWRLRSERCIIGEPDIYQAIRFLREKGFI